MQPADRRLRLQGAGFRVQDFGVNIFRKILNPDA
jgi:hypothetical protein